MEKINPVVKIDLKSRHSCVKSEHVLLARASALQVMTLVDLYFGMSFGVAVGRRSGPRLATKLVDHYFHHSFVFSFFLFFSLRCLCFSQNKCLNQKTYLAKVVWNTQKPRVGPLSRPCRPFCGPMVAILVGVALQAIASASCAARLVFTILSLFSFYFFLRRLLFS